ncbi:MAG: trypsin-like peptidase domain-containing protein [Ignavibacterium sp.]|nr:trypsin-like peptidase domain-containing protein [Ignavibacterium sp.]
MITFRSYIITITLFIGIIIAGYFLFTDSEQIFIPEESASRQQQLLTAYKNSLNDDISNSRRNIITKTVELVSPAVVGINVIEIRQVRDPFSYFFDDPFFRQFFGDRRTNNRKVQGLGSGYIISPDGFIITNDHVAGNATEITVTLTDGSHHQAQIIGTDAISDICLLKIEGSDFPYIDLGDSEDIIIGEWVIALGNPFGLFDLNDKPTVTVGVISALGMNLEPINNRFYLNMIQTDAAINGGNSGGPLVNSLGEVIGMNTLIFTAGGAQGNIGLGFAIPINKVRKIISELKAKGSIDRDFQIGMRIQTIDEGIARYYNLSSSRGVIVTRITPGSPAEKSDIRVGDIITEVENFKINNENTLYGVFQEFRTDQTIAIRIVRENKELNKRMKLEKNR